MILSPQPRYITFSQAHIHTHSQLITNRNQLVQSQSLYITQTLSEYLIYKALSVQIGEDGHQPFSLL